MIRLNFANTNNRCKYIASNLRPSRCLLDMIIPWKQIIDLWAAILVMMIYFLTLDVPVDMFLSIPSIAFLMSSSKHHLLEEHPARGSSSAKRDVPMSGNCLQSQEPWREARAQKGKE